MFGLTFITDAWIATALYVFLRFAGMIIVSPVFGRKNLPGMLRIGFCLIMTTIVMIILPTDQYAASQNMFIFFVNGIKEVLLGMMMGYLTLVLFSVAVSAGQLIDMQIGFGLSNFFDPQLGMQMALSSNFLNIILTILFFITNGHHMLIQLMFSSFQIVNPGDVGFSIKVVEMIVLYFTWFILLIVKVCMPIIAVTIIIEFALGIIVKSMPQMNMFVVGIPLKLVMGLIVLILFLSAFVLILQGAFDQMFQWHQKIVQGLIS